MGATFNPGEMLLLWMSECAEPASDSVVLAVRAGKGDLAAFDQLMRSHERRVYRTAVLLLGRPEDADDAVQETFLRLFRSLPRYQAGKAFEPWLYRIAVNVCRDLGRKRRWKQWVSLDGWLASGGVEPRAAGSSDSRRNEIAAALATLSERERSAVVLRDIEGLTAAEAGRVLGISEGTVRSHASRGRARLRVILGANER